MFLKVNRSLCLLAGIERILGSHAPVKSNHGPVDPSTLDLPEGENEFTEILILLIFLLFLANLFALMKVKL